MFRGTGFGAEGEAFGEAVFNTGMAGYQEVLTDPSYAGQIVAMTAPQQGNYGVNRGRCRVGPRAGGRVRGAGGVAACRRTGARRARLPVSCLVGGRRGDRGHRHPAADAAAPRARRDAGGDLDRRSGRRVAGRAGARVAGDGGRRPRPHGLGGGAVRGRGPGRTRETTTRGRVFRVAAYDFGIKRNILRRLAAKGCETTVFPAETPAGRGRRRTGSTASSCRTGRATRPPPPTASPPCAALLGKVPIFGICLGHQLLALALGGRTYKMPFGHRGVNQPVKNLRTGVVEITSHNHGFAVDPARLDAREGDGRGADTDFGRADAHPLEPERRHARGAPLPRRPRVLGPVPPRGGARTARLALPVRGLPRPDGDVA